MSAAMSARVLRACRRLAAIGMAWLVTGLLTGCVHYQAKPLTPTGTLSTIEQRTLDDLQLKTFLEANHVTLTETTRWDLHALTLLAFYFHPDLDEARAAA